MTLHVKPIPNSQDLTKFKMKTWFLSHSDANIKINDHLNLIVTVLFDGVTPRAMKYVKFRPGCFDSVLLDLVLMAMA